MCDKGKSKGASFGQEDFGRVDECMAHLISFLNLYGIKTMACCCGHGKYPMSIIVDVNGARREIVSGINIERKSRYYKRDKKGYYYIPEVREWIIKQKEN